MRSSNYSAAILIRISYLLFSLFILPQAYADLPQALLNSLKSADVKQEDIAIVVSDTTAPNTNLILHDEKQMLHPASVMKLVTTYAALDMLGPNYTWTTAAFIDGNVEDGVLTGSLYIRGSGDPSMTTERMRELFRLIIAAGIHTIKGELLIDRSAYNIADIDPGAFDGEPLRPYNVRPDAMLINYKTIAFTLNPSIASSGDTIPIIMTPDLTGVQYSNSIKVSNQRCGDWQTGLSADFSNPLDIVFTGTFPKSCGPKQWFVAYPDPNSHALRTIANLWTELGGTVDGKIAFGLVSPTSRLIGSVDSKSLAEIVRDINKYSNNVMAQSAFLALSLPEQKRFLSPKPLPSAASYEESQKKIADWWQKKFPQTTAPVMENGSGLSRYEAISVQSLAIMLQDAWFSSVMPEFIASLPVASVDGTMRNSKASASAHIKTGSIRNVAARAGYVLDKDGQRRIFVFFINSNNAYKAKNAFDVLIDWTAEQ